MAIDSAGSRDEWVPLMAHGEQAYFLAACFLPLAASEQVVLDWMNTKQRSSAVEWVPFWDLDPRRDEMPGASNRQTPNQALQQTAGAGRLTGVHSSLWPRRG